MGGHLPSEQCGKALRVSLHSLALLGWLESIQLINIHVGSASSAHCGYSYHMTKQLFST